MKKDSKHLHLGRIGELLAKAKFIEYDFDVYSTEVDHQGIDFIIKNKKGEYFEIQVKATNGNYVFMRKEIFNPKNNLFLMLLAYKDDQPNYILIPSMEWKDNLQSFMTDKNYDGKKSAPEYGIYTSDKYLEKIKETYSFKKIVNRLK